MWGEQFGVTPNYAFEGMASPLPPREIGAPGGDFNEGYYKLGKYGYVRLMY